MPMRISLPMAVMLGVAFAGCTPKSSPDATPAAGTPAAAAPAPGADGIVKGTVSYRERMALPSDAEVDVWITDMTAGLITAAVVTAQTSVKTEGRQVPIPFELRYDPSRTDATHTYGLKAVIKSGGETLFETPEAVPVITKGSRSDVAVWLKRATPAAAASALTRSAWRLVDLGGAGVIDNAEATLEFSEAGKITGRGSCNSFFGTVVVAGDKIAFGPIGSTKMACADPIGAQEKAYFEALQNAERYAIEGSSLLLYGKGMEKPLRFQRKER